MYLWTVRNYKSVLDLNWIQFEFVYGIVPMHTIHQYHSGGIPVWIMMVNGKCVH